MSHHDPNHVSRRRFLKSGFGFLGAMAGTLVGGPALARAFSGPTPRQTLGPFFPDDGDPVVEVRENLDFRLPVSEANDHDLTQIQGHSETARGQAIHLNGKVLHRQFGGKVEPLPGAVLILWNASASGRYNHRGDQENQRFRHPHTGDWIEREHDPHFQYWGHAVTDAEGRYRFKTILPGFYPVDIENGWYRPPHLHFMILAPGVPQLVTQLYFKGEDIPNNAFIQELNAGDSILRDPKLSKEEQEGLIVEYRKDPTGKLKDGLVGRYDFLLTL